MKTSNRNQHLSRGQTMVEFAMVASVFLLLLMGIVQMGRAVYSYNFVSYAARDATRYAIVHGSKSLTPAATSDVQNFVVKEAHGFDTSQFTVTTTWSPNNNPGSFVNVVVKYNFSLSIPFFGKVNLPLTSTSQMVISQ